MKDIYDEIYNEILNGIKNGRYKIGDKIPSIRHQTLFYNVKKYYIEKVYEKLFLQGYILPKKGKGYYVESIDGEFYNLNLPEHLNATNTLIPTIRMYNSNDKIKNCIISLIKSSLISLSNSNLEMFFYSSSGTGHPELRKKISEYVYKLYNIKVNPDQVLLSSSKINLINYLISEFKKKNVILENPSSHLISNMFESYEDIIIYQNIDKEGMIIDNLPKCPSLFYLETYDQFPTGINYTDNRKHELVDFALKNDCFLVENLFRKEFLFKNQNLLYGNSHSFLTGDFSNIFPFSLKFAFLILPDKFIPENFKTDISSLTEHFILNCFKHNRLYNASEHIWRLLLDIRNVFIKELNNRNIEFNGIYSGKYISLIIENEEILENAKRNIKIFPQNVHYNFLEYNGNTLFNFDYSCINIDKVGEFIDFILFNKINL